MKKTRLHSSAHESLGGKLIFFRDNLRRVTHAPPPGEAATMAPPEIRPVVRALPHGDTDQVDTFDSTWNEPRSARTRMQKMPPADSQTAVSSVRLPPSPAAQKPVEPPRRSITNARHNPLPATRPNKPDAPPPDPRVFGYLVAGGSRVLKPLRREARIQRNRVIFISVLCVIFLLIVWKIVAR